MLAQKLTPPDAPTARIQTLTMAIEHHAAGRLDDASALYQQLYAADRRDSDVVFLMGVLCCDLGLFEAACRFLDEALAVAPNFPEASNQLLLALNGLAEQQMHSGKMAEARIALERAVALVPGDAAALQSLGRIELANGDPAAAETRLLASLARRPQDARTLNWLGLARLQREHYAAAESSLRQALRLAPDLHQARNNLGMALYRRGRVTEANECFEAALAQDPRYTKARINHGVTLRLLGRHEEARVELEMVLAELPLEFDALNNLGVIHQDLGNADRALEYLSRAVAVAPAAPTARWNLALTQLLRNDFDNGWANYEARWEGCEHLRGTYHMPPDRAWQGEDLRGKQLLVWAEQGLGDSLQFIRFADDVARRGAKVSVLAPPEIAALLRSAPGVSEVLTPGAPIQPRYDYHVPLMSLPCRLGLSADPADLRGAAPYLEAAPHRVNHWRERLGGHRALRVGLCWAGNARRQHPELMSIDRRRSLALENLAPILRVPGCSFFSLQKGAAAAQVSAPSGAVGNARGAPGKAPVHDFSAEWPDFAETAAFVANLDLIISVDTAVVHLAGAMGKPVWLLNRFDTCWRWLENRSDSAWYSTLRQFRQPAWGDWQPVIAEVAAALAHLSGAAGGVAPGAVPLDGAQQPTKRPGDDS